MGDLPAPPGLLYLLYRLSRSYSTSRFCKFIVNSESSRWRRSFCSHSQFTGKKFMAIRYEPCFPLGRNVGD